MSNEHIQQIASTIKEQEKRLKEAYLKIETGAHFLAKLVQGTDIDSVKVRREVVKDLLLLKEKREELVRAETVEDSDNGEFYVDLSPKEID
ncbi:hypothetical protein, partial [Staphylococcus aureus]|uniref:hypothetical protein n=1 Tax=Staphylococcus aureus TaxID=1280 RepID=UPI0039BEC8A6